MIAFSCQKKEEKSVATSSSASASAPTLWATNPFPLDIRITDAFDATETTAIQAGFNQWEDGMNNKKDWFTFVSGDRPANVATDSGSTLSADRKIVVYKTTNWTYPDTRVIAYVQIYVNGYNLGTSSEYNNIETADVFMNYQHNTFSTTGSGGYDIATVVLHEFGHVLGLPHISDSPYSNKNISIMYPSIGPSDIRRVIKQYDINKLAGLYNITLGSNGLPASTLDDVENRYIPFDDGVPRIIQIELRDDGECIHRENGVIKHQHHSPTLKKMN